MKLNIVRSNIFFVILFFFPNYYKYKYIYFLLIVMYVPSLYLFIELYAYYDTLGSFGIAPTQDLIHSLIKR